MIFLKKKRDAEKRKNEKEVEAKLANVAMLSNPGIFAKMAMMVPIINVPNKPRAMPLVLFIRNV